MRPSELRDLSDGELTDHLRTARRELFGLREDEPATPQQPPAELAEVHDLRRRREG